MNATQRRYIQSMRSDIRDLRRKQRNLKKRAEVYNRQALDLEKKVSVLEQQDTQAKARRNAPGTVR